MKGTLNYLVLMKPCLGYPWSKYRRGKGIEVTDPAALIEELEALHRVGIEVIVKELIPGPAANLRSVCCYLGSDGSVLALMGQRKIRQAPVADGVRTLVESMEAPPEAEAVVHFLKAMGYAGLAEVEFKKDERDGKWKLIQFNLRLWEQNAQATVCGLDFPYIQYLDLIGCSTNRAFHLREGVRWLALGEDLQAPKTLLRRGERSV